MSRPSPTLPPAVTASAGTNIALVKYWGKRDVALNLPVTGSLSLTLAGLGTRTRVRFAADAGTPDGSDRVWLDGAPADPAFVERVSRFLNLVRQQAGISLPAEVKTENSVPTAAGLASSASGFAALAAAASRAAGLSLDPAALGALARRGSGSAPRSLLGGFVEMAPGTRPDGTDAFATPLLPPEAWPVRLVVAKTAGGPKSIGSTAAMERTAHSSPYFAAWTQSVPADLAAARAAIAARDLAALGAVAERSALRMHASAFAAVPPIIYWEPATLAVMKAVAAWRAGTGPVGYFTMDAGPHVKVLCAAADADRLAHTLAAVPGVLETLVAAPGPGVVVTEEAP